MRKNGIFMQLQYIICKCNIFELIIIMFDFDLVHKSVRGSLRLLSRSTVWAPPVYTLYTRVIAAVHTVAAAEFRVFLEAKKINTVFANGR